MNDNKLNEERERLVDGVIRNHMIWSMGAGFIPIPVADFIAVSAIQLDMIRQMCKVYGLEFKESQGKAIVSSLTSSGLAKLGARAIIKLVPGIGSVIGGVALSIVSGASTFALGEVFKKHFETGGTILDFDVDNLKKIYDDKFEKGKEMARKIKEDQEAGKTTIIDISEEGEIEEISLPRAAHEEDLASDVEADAFRRLRELKELKDAGVLTDEEFMELKKRLIDQI